ncbi:unnamed protein product [Lupinus luteus]|uniref:Uncharacterized protein n=1 Tax=Lupinus luteus TaxID=3873 RepID=A0AAV1XI47_LUPLU
MADSSSSSSDSASYILWNELEKENKEFFEPYMKSKNNKEDRMSQEETTRMIEKMISKSDSSKDGEED